VTVDHGGADAPPDERARAAREVEDLIAHEVSVMLVQARAAERLLAAGRPEAAEAIEAVAASGRAALGDARCLRAEEALGPAARSIAAMVVQAEAARRVVARAPGEALETVRRIAPQAQATLAALRDLLAPAAGAAERAPQPSLADLPALLARSAEHGLPADLRVEGEPSGVPGAVGLAGYRIVQAALGDAARRRAARACVRVAWAPAEVLLEVRDDAPGPAGAGLDGARERAALLGGTLEAGPAPRGFRLRARLPA
jgi:signal transduction histidine kinase